MRLWRIFLDSPDAPRDGYLVAGMDADDALQTLGYMLRDTPFVIDQRRYDNELNDEYWDLYHAELDEGASPREAETYASGAAERYMAERWMPIDTDSIYNAYLFIQNVTVRPTDEKVEYGRCPTFGSVSSDVWFFCNRNSNEVPYDLNDLIQDVEESLKTKEGAEKYRRIIRNALAGLGYGEGHEYLEGLKAIAGIDALWPSSSGSKPEVSKSRASGGSKAKSASTRASKPKPKAPAKKTTTKKVSSGSVRSRSTASKKSKGVGR